MRVFCYFVFVYVVFFIIFSYVEVEVSNSIINGFGKYIFSLILLGIFIVFYLLIIVKFCVIFVGMLSVEI